MEETDNKEKETEIEEEQNTEEIPDEEARGDEKEDQEAASTEPEAAELEEEKTEVERLREALAEAEEKAAKNLQGWQRAQATLENYRKRVATEREIWTADAQAVLLNQLLPVLDDFQRAFGNVPEKQADAKWLEGIRLVEQKLLRVLAISGVKAIEVEPGDEFDPHLHEAVMSREAEGFEEGQIITELQTGYRQGERVLRPTLVIVAQAPSESQPTTQTEEEPEAGGEAE